MSLSLKTIEWHDLPLKHLNFSANGVEWCVTPFIEKTTSYDALILRLWDAARFSFDIQGTCTQRNLAIDMEIHRFEFVLMPEAELQAR